MAFQIQNKWQCFIVLVHFLIPALCQNPIFDPREQDTTANVFYMTSKSDCSDELKDIYSKTAVVKGVDQTSLGTGPTSCTIRITSSSVYKGIQLEIQIISMKILDCLTTFTIYDGQSTQKLRAFDCHSNQNINRQHLVTTGDTVTFMMSRPNVDSVSFDIEITVKRLVGGVEPGNTRGTFFSFDKFDQLAIVGMIGGAYALVLIICIGVVSYCFVRYRGLNKKWETHQLATLKTDKILDERDRYRGRDRMASQNATYTDDDDEADNFKEKVITPRVNTGSRWKPKDRRDRRPPSFEEATRETSTEGSSEDDEDEETEESSDNDSTRKRLTTSSEEESETETESEESSDDNRGAQARKRKNNKSKQKSKPRRRRQSSIDDASSQRTEPRQRQPHTQPPPLQPGVPYGAYPPGGQFVPVMAAPPQFQPVQMIPPNYPPPQYPAETSHLPPASQGQVQPTDPPVYSYLVRRGYTPLDAKNGRNSPAGSGNSSQRTGPVYRDEPDTPLQSGVEYMRR